MTKQEKIKETYGDTYDWDENGWLWYSVDEHGESGYDPFGEYDTRNHKDGSYEWRPISLRGIENNNSWIKIESEADLPKENGDYWFYKKDAVWYPISEHYYHAKSKRCKQQTMRSYTHYQPIIKPEPPLY